MIVGPTGGGKTVVLDTLKAARLKAEGVVVKYYVINPKAQPLNELYGVMDPVTRDWTDGTISASRGAFTPSRRLVSRRAGHGWSVFRF
jgi:dynein heavy chain